MTALTEAQIAALRPQYTEYPERRLIVPAYPPARRKRGLTLADQAALPEEEPGSLPKEGLTGGPTVRLWSVSLYSNVAAQGIVRGSPSFTGPALIHSLTGLVNATQASGNIDPVQIAYDTAPYADTDAGPADTKIPGTHILAAADPFHNAATAIPFDVGLVSNLSGSPVSTPLGVYVPLDRFYIGVRIEGQAAGLSYASFVLRIIENAPPESIEWV